MILCSQLTSIEISDDYIFAKSSLFPERLGKNYPVSLEAKEFP